MIVLKAGSSSPSNQIVTFGGELGIVQPTLGSERIGKACPRLTAGTAATMAIEAKSAIRGWCLKSFTSKSAQ